MDFVTIDNKDSIVYRIATRLRARSIKGMETYGQTLDRTDLNFEDWCNHAIEEALDLALYLEKIKHEWRQQTR